jgi:hypothetical protein
LRPYPIASIDVRRAERDPTGERISRRKLHLIECVCDPHESAVEDLWRSAIEAPIWQSYLGIDLLKLALKIE